MSTSTMVNRVTWAERVKYSLRHLSAVTWAGALLGLIVGGIGGRLAMMLIATLNPNATGTVSDDGFVIGHLTFQSLGLLALATLLGVLGGGIYYVLRGLLIGPRWFQILSIGLGPAVVVGTMLVHVRGVDYTVLQPVWLSIVLFVTIPGTYAALLTVVAEHYLRQDGRFMTASIWLAGAPLLLWLPIAPALGALALSWLIIDGIRRTDAGATTFHHPIWPWVGRVGLTVIFMIGLIRLLRDTITLLAQA